MSVIYWSGPSLIDSVKSDSFKIALTEDDMDGASQKQKISMLIVNFLAVCYAAEKYFGVPIKEEILEWLLLPL